MDMLNLCFFLVAATACSSAAPQQSQPTIDNVNFNAYIDALLAYIKVDVDLPSIKLPNIEAKASLGFISVDTSLTGGIISGAEDERRLATAEVLLTENGVAHVEAQLNVNLQVHCGLSVKVAPFLDIEGIVDVGISNIVVSLYVDVEVAAHKAKLHEIILGGNEKIEIKVTTDPPVPVNDIVNLLTNEMDAIIRQDIFPVLNAALDTAFTSAIENVAVEV